MIQLTQQQIDAQIEQAIASQDTIDAQEPRAKAVEYDERTDRVVIHFTNNSIFSFPTAAIEELAQQNKQIKAEVILTPGRKGLRWQTPDIDLSIQGLLLGRVGSKHSIAEVL